VSELEVLRQENAYLKQQLAELKRLLYGKKSERFIAPNPLQASLFELEPVEAPEPEKQTIERTKPKSSKKPVRQVLPAHIPRIDRIIEPTGVDLDGAVKIDELVTEYLNYIPSRLYVERIIRPKYKLKDNSIVAAPLDDAQPIEKSNVGAELLAYLLISKYCDHLPLFRLAKMFKRENVVIAESTMNDWVQNGMQLLKPLFEHLHKRVSRSSYLQADETPIPVLESIKPGSTHKGYYWVYHSPIDDIISFQYHKSRSADAVRDHLQNFKGYLQSDGYSGYNQFEAVPDVISLACMSHARRKFHEALTNDEEKAREALSLIKVLYDIETRAREQQMNHQQRYAIRQQEALPALQQLKQWLVAQQNKVLPKSAIGNAVFYTLKLWDRLTVYTEDGKLEIDNNLIENKIRPVAIGRKNYMFAGSHNAAARAGALYSFMAMCQTAEVNPMHWLTDVLKRINNHSIQHLDQLLPANWKKLNPIPEINNT